MLEPRMHFEAAVCGHAVLTRYAQALQREGFDRMETLRFITPEDMARLDIVVGHRRLLLNIINEYFKAAPSAGATTATRYCEHTGGV